MKTTNNFSLVGRLAADAEVKNFNNSSKAEMRIAVSRIKGNETITGWINIEAWKNDNNDFEELKKGKLIQFNGFFAPDAYTTKDGKNIANVKLVAAEWTPVTKKEEEATE